MGKKESKKRKNIVDERKCFLRDLKKVKKHRSTTKESEKKQNIVAGRKFSLRDLKKIKRHRSRTKESEKGKISLLGENFPSASLRRLKSTDLLECVYSRRKEKHLYRDKNVR